MELRSDTLGERAYRRRKGPQSFKSCQTKTCDWMILLLTQNMSDAGFYESNIRSESFERLTSKSA